MQITWYLSPRCTALQDWEVDVFLRCWSMWHGALGDLHQAFPFPRRGKWSCSSWLIPRDTILSSLPLSPQPLPSWLNGSFTWHLHHFCNGKPPASPPTFLPASSDFSKPQAFLMSFQQFSLQRMEEKHGGEEDHVSVWAAPELWAASYLYCHHFPLAFVTLPISHHQHIRLRVKLSMSQMYALVAWTDQLYPGVHQGQRCQQVREGVAPASWVMPGLHWTA